MCCLFLALAVYAHYRTPGPDVGDVNGRPIVPSSFVLIAPEHTRGPTVAAPTSSRRGLLRLAAPERARCWTLFRIIVDVFRYAPEQRESLERVLGAYAQLPHLGPRRAPCKSPEATQPAPPKGDR